MMKKLIIFTAAIFVAFACSTTKTSSTKGKKVVDPVVGTWNYTVKNTPEGDLTGDFVIAKDSDTYTGMLNSSQGSLELQDVKIEDGNLSCNFDYSGYKIMMTGKFEGENFTGKLTADYNDFPVTAVKNP